MALEKLANAKEAPHFCGASLAFAFGVERLACESGFNGGCDLRRIRRDGRLEARYRLAVAVEEKLGEVPLDVAGELRVSRGIGKEMVERGLVVALDGDLGHHGKADVVIA
jgi:hypothetical protein